MSTTSPLARLQRDLRAAANAVEMYTVDPTGARLANVEQWASVLIPSLSGLLAEESHGEPMSALEGSGPYRVRMTALNGTGSPIADRELTAIPQPGDEVNAASGRLYVAARAFNFDPAIPADVILFMASPNEGLDGSEHVEVEHDCALACPVCGEVLAEHASEPCGSYPRCTGCGRDYDEHDNRDLLCPRPGGGFNESHCYTRA